nr:MAG TPA: hypothetical protein [Caudoviricetes sp.]
MKNGSFPVGSLIKFLKPALVSFICLSSTSVTV